MPIIDFPTKTLGQGTGDSYDFNGKRWIWNGRAWTLQGGSPGPTGPTGATGAISGDFVLSINGITGPVGLSAGANIGITWSGKTLTISSTASGVGGVTSVNGRTGAVTNVAFTNEGNTFSVKQIFNNGIGLCGGRIEVQGITNVDISIVGGNTLTITTVDAENGSYNSPTTISLGYSVAGDYYVQSIKTNLDVAGNADIIHILPEKSGTLLNTGSTYAQSVNGITGPVGITGSANISVSGSGKTLTISFVGDAGGVTSVNGVTGAVGVAAGTAIAIATSGKTLTISNTGVTSFNGQTGAISFVNFVSSLNGSTGAITNVARTNQGNTFSVRQVFDAGMTMSGGARIDGGVECGSTLTVKIFNPTAYPSSPIISLEVVDQIPGYPPSVISTTHRVVGTLDVLVSGVTHTLPTTSGTVLNTGNISTAAVTSVNGVSGAVTNVAFVNQQNTFTERQNFVPQVNFNSGISLSSGNTQGLIFSETYRSFNLGFTSAHIATRGRTLNISGVGLTAIPSVDTDTAIALHCYSVDQATIFSQSIATNTGAGLSVVNRLPINSGTLLNTASTYVQTVNGITGSVGITAGSNITITQSGNTLTVASTASGGGVPDFVLYRLGII